MKSGSRGLTAGDFGIIFLMVHQRAVLHGRKHSRKRRHSMSKAPSTLTAAVMLAVFLCLGGAKIFAQCTLCIDGGTDQTCSGSYDDCGSDYANCTSSGAFTVPCDGSYTLSAVMDCNGEGCHCSSCVHVVKETTGVIVGWTDSDCNQSQCQASVTVSLLINTTYRLYVCKRPCDGLSTCEECDTDCKAKGWLHREVLSCP